VTTGTGLLLMPKVKQGFQIWGDSSKSVAMLFAQWYHLDKQASSCTICTSMSELTERAAAPEIQQAQFKHLAMIASNTKIHLPDEEKQHSDCVHE